MSRQASTDAQKNVDAANNRASGYSTAAGADSSSLVPYYQKQLVNPSGLSPQETANMLTSSSQSLGGSQSSAVGSGNLMAARSRNAAGVSAAADDSARAAMRTQSGNALSVDEASTNLANQHQSEAAQGLSNLYGTNTSAVLSSLGLSTAAIQALTSANAQSQSNWATPLNDATQIASSFVGKH